MLFIGFTGKEKLIQGNFGSQILNLLQLMYGRSTRIQGVFPVAVGA